MPEKKSKSAKVRSRRGSRRFLVFLLLLTVFCFVIFKYYDVKMRPIIKIAAVSKVEDVATEVINGAVLKELEKENIQYGDLVNLNKDEQGNITAITTDTIKINKLKSNLALAVVDDVSVMENKSVYVPLGSLMGMEVLSAQGPNIPVKIFPIGSVYTTIHQSFESAGINQTIHRIMVRVTVTADLVLPTETTDAEYHIDVLIAETVIVGKIPDTYLNIQSLSDNIEDKLTYYSQNWIDNKVIQ